MAQSPPQYQNFPPYISPHSPTTNRPLPDQYPPQKKQRLSSSAISPHSSPQLANGILPNPGLHAPPAPYLNGPPRQYSPPSAQQSPGIGTMGPPNRPVAAEKQVDVNELGDVMASSGVDLKDEESQLLNSYGRAAQQGDSFSGPGSSFNSVYSTSAPGYFDQHNYGHNTLSQNIPGDRSSFYGAGNLNQPAVTPEVMEDQVLQAEKRAIRRRNEIRQYHLNDPFLQPGVLQGKLKGSCNHAGVKVEPPGSRSISSGGSQDPNLTTKVNVVGPDNHPKLAVFKGKSLIAPPSGNLTEILTLLSLSCKDRIRTLLEDSATFAKGRRSTSGGVVPPEFAGIAIGQGKAEEATVPPAAPSASNHKRSFSQMNANTLPTPESDSPQLLKTIAFPNKDGKRLADLKGTERSLEEEREKKRQKRAPNSDNTRPSSVAGTPGPGTPGSLMDADGAAKKPLTKKELKRQENSRATEAQQHAATNTAASMALGGGRGGPTWLKGSGGGTKSWMTSKSTANTSFAPMPKKDTSASTKAAPTGPAAQKVGKSFGDFREDSIEGAGIQLRDTLIAMELDIKEKRALARAYGKINSLKD